MPTPHVLDTASVPVTLSTTRWGSRSAARRALLVHGLGSTGAVWWRIADSLAHAGYEVVAPDLRGHGSSPRTLSYRLDDHVADLAALGDGWDLLIGHSLGGLLAAAAATTDGFTHRLLLLDPVLEIAEEDFEQVVAEQLAEVQGTPDPVAYLRDNPRWHPEDAALKAAAAVTPYVIERTLRDSAPWHFAGYARRLTVPTLILGADPTVGTMFSPQLGIDLAAANPHITVHTVPGAGHSIHRDDPAAVLTAIERQEH